MVSEGNNYYLKRHCSTRKCKLFRMLMCIKASERLSPYNWKLSLNLGDQALDLDFVVNFLFLSERYGPMRCTSTNGLNMPPAVVRHLRSFAATTAHGMLY